MAVVVSAVALAGCASAPRLRDADRLALYEQHAGAPVASFPYSLALDGWTPLGESALAVWAGPGRAYLLKLYGPCTSLDVAPMISLTRSVGQVWAGFDRVIPLGMGVRIPEMPCTIRSIQPLDVKAIRQAERDASKIAAPVERPAQGGQGSAAPANQGDGGT